MEDDKAVIENLECYYCEGELKHFSTIAYNPVFLTLLFIYTVQARRDVQKVAIASTK